MATRAQNKRSALANATAGGVDQGEASHQLKLSIDLLRVKDLKCAANLICAYQLKLSSGLHSFRSE